MTVRDELQGALLNPTVGTNGMPGRLLFSGVVETYKVSRELQDDSVCCAQRNDEQL